METKQIGFFNTSGRTSRQIMLRHAVLERSLRHEAESDPATSDIYTVIFNEMYDSQDQEMVFQV